MALLSHNKFMVFVPLFFVLLLKPIFAEQLQNKSEILRKSNDCLNGYRYKGCNNLLLEIERLQLVEKDKNRYKCQTSLLGLQTELIEAYHFKKLKKFQHVIMIPFVIKNC